MSDGSSTGGSVFLPGTVTLKPEPGAIDDGGPAFPVHVLGDVRDGGSAFPHPYQELRNGEALLAQFGMSRRFYVAAKVMAAHFSCQENAPGVGLGARVDEAPLPTKYMAQLARYAWAAADALIAAESERAK